MKIGFIGLGNMGQPIARNLIDAGHQLTVYNRTFSVVEKFASQYKAQVAKSPEAAAAEAEVLITMLANDGAVEAVISGTEEMRGALYGLNKGALHVSMSTISPVLSKKLAKIHAEVGQEYIAAPVFGRPEAAEAAQLWVVAAGKSEQIERCLTLFEAIGQGTFKLGEDPESANVVKLAGNFLIASMLESLGEAFALVKKSGIPPEEFLEIVNAVFKSPIYANYGTIIAHENYETAKFKLRLGLKDIKLVMEAAEEVNVPLPLASLIRDHFLSAIAKGQGDIDWSGLGRVNAENAGL
ncbi:MAG: NAD(P)-dependent oxidoreductase [Prochloraceae cyanobacterium]|nr:NAD(P)-dependent oxidoreductase [Prochloraceae cyanobacterium]